MRREHVESNIHRARWPLRTIELEIDKKEKVCRQKQRKREKAKERGLRRRKR